jgi:hypothetical protein
MRNAHGMDGGSNAGQDMDRPARVASRISTRTKHARAVLPGRLPAGISLWLLVTAALLCAGPSLARATSSFYWYGENDSTCWQTGQLGSPSTACGETVGPGFLSKSGSLKGGLAHMDEVSAGGSAEGIQLPDGNYCDYYKLGDDITIEESNNQGGVTGYTPPTPYKSYQESDPHGNVCQADGATWGQEIGTGDSSNNCYNTCGMHHIVSLHELSDHPWASWFGEPSLAVSAEALVHTVTFSGESEYNMAWGYVCPLLEDTTTGYTLEYCFQEWRSVYNPPIWKEERIGTCGPNGYDTVDTYFWPGTTLATELGGSANTFEFSGTPSGWTSFSAEITEANLLAAINRAKKPPTESGCGTNFSTNPEKYVLVGVEQGVEGEHKLSGIGAAGRNLQVRTEYTPRPPTVTTEAASGVQQEQATLNGNVNPNGSSTHYYFQYGETTSYGSSTPEGNSGSGTSTMPVNSTITKLKADATYHYRIVASSQGGASYGSDHTLTTERTSTADTLSASNGEQWAYYRGTNGRLYAWYWNDHTWQLEWLGETGVVGSNLSAGRNVNGEQWVYYRGTNGQLYAWYWNNHTWQLEWLGEAGAMAGAPKAVFSSNGEQEIFYRGTNGRLYFWAWNNSAWKLESLGETSAMGGEPAPVLASNGEQEIFYRGTNGRLYFWAWNNSAWKLESLGETSAMGGEPAPVLASNGEQEVFYGGVEGKLFFWGWNNSTWKLEWLGEAGAM